MSDFMKQSKFMICLSLFERLPSDFFTKGTKRNSLVAPVAILAASF